MEMGAKISFLRGGRTPVPFEGKQTCSLVLKTTWLSLPIQPWHFNGALSKDSVIPPAQDVPVGSSRAGGCTGTTGCAGEHTAPELRPSPSVRCVNTVPSHQVANSILTCRVKHVLILRPGGYFEITAALNRW